MRISIQPQDITAAEAARADGALRGSVCPTAQALIRLLYSQVYVGPNYATVKRGEWRGRFSIPLLLTEQIESWDAGYGFAAGDYDLIPVKIPPREQVRR